jgi:hypothetical protein
VSDPALLDAYRRQIQRLGEPATVHLAWSGQAGVDPADLAAIYREVTGREPPEDAGDPRQAARRLADLVFRGLT